MSIDIEELRSAVAAKHGILLHNSDPIFVTVMLNELVLGRYVDVITETYTVHNKALASLMAEHKADAKAIGGKVITDAANHAAETIRLATQIAIADAQKAATVTTNELQALREDLDRRVHVAESAKTIALAAAGSAIISVIAVVLVMLVK